MDQKTHIVVVEDEPPSVSCSWTISQGSATGLRDSSIRGRPAPPGRTRNAGARAARCRAARRGRLRGGALAAREKRPGLHHHGDGGRATRSTAWSGWRPAPTTTCPNPSIRASFWPAIKKRAAPGQRGAVGADPVGPRVRMGPPRARPREATPAGRCRHAQRRGAVGKRVRSPEGVRSRIPIGRWRATGCWRRSVHREMERCSTAPWICASRVSGARSRKDRRTPRRSARCAASATCSCQRTTSRTGLHFTGKRAPRECQQFRAPDLRILIQGGGTHDTQPTPPIPKGFAAIFH